MTSELKVGHAPLMRVRLSQGKTAGQMLKRTCKAGRATTETPWAKQQEDKNTTTTQTRDHKLATRHVERVTVAAR